jgi:hypothetical protein
MSCPVINEFTDIFVSESKCLFIALFCSLLIWTLFYLISCMNSTPTSPLSLMNLSSTRFTHQREIKCTLIWTWWIFLAYLRSIALGNSCKHVCVTAPECVSPSIIVGNEWRQVYVFHFVLPKFNTVQALALLLTSKTFSNFIFFN